MAARVSSLFVPVAVCAGWNDLAVVANVVTARQQRPLLAHHAALGRRHAAAGFESHARVGAPVFRDASLRCLDHRAAAYWRIYEDGSTSASSTRLPALYRWNADCSTRCGRGPLVWF